MNVSIPPGIMFTLAHPDAAENASKGRRIDRADSYRGLRWWTSQNSRSASKPKGAEPEECCSTQSACLAAVRA